MNSLDSFQKEYSHISAINEHNSSGHLLGFLYLFIFSCNQFEVHQQLLPLPAGAALCVVDGTLAPSSGRNSEQHL